ncbi:helix-turn-helix transcriptional regulator, partial [Kineococcus rhizosphaerae]|uniref:helix-turn-helix transcriptional regulator n=1 Tax=Kineococcus rhizosphaerae TaxID=559628 RepID=UPI001B80E4C9
VTSHVTGLLTVAETVAETGASESTIRRRLREKAFPGAVRETGGGWRVPREDLVAAGLLTGSPVEGEAVEETVVDVRDPVVVDVALVERAARAEARVEVLDGLADEVARLRSDLAEWRDRAVGAEATRDAAVAEAERLREVDGRRAGELAAAVERAARAEGRAEGLLARITPRAVEAVDVDSDVEDAVVDEEDAVEPETAGETLAEEVPPVVDEVEEVERPGAWSAVRGWFRRR